MYEVSNFYSYSGLHLETRGFRLRNSTCELHNWDYLAKSGQDGWLERSGDGASLGQEYGAVSGGIGCQRIAFVND